MTSKQKILKKLIKVYSDKKNWREPALQDIADKIGVSKSLVFLYLKELKEKGVL